MILSHSQAKPKILKAQIYTHITHTHQIPCNTDTLYLISLCHRAERAQQDLHQVQVIVASSHMQTRVTHLEAQRGNSMVSDT